MQTDQSDQAEQPSQAAPAQSDRAFVPTVTGTASTDKYSDFDNVMKNNAEVASAPVNSYRYIMSQIPYASYKNAAGVDSEAQRYSDLAAVGDAYERSKPTYGSLAEGLAQGGLTGSGVSDRQQSLSYQTLLAGQKAADATYRQNEANNASKYADFVRATKAETDEAIAETHAKNISDIESQIANISLLADANTEIKKILTNAVSIGDITAEEAIDMAARHGVTFETSEFGDLDDIAGKYGDVDPQSAADLLTAKTDDVIAYMEKNGIRSPVAIEDSVWRKRYDNLPQSEKVKITKHFSPFTPVDAGDNENTQEGSSETPNGGDNDERFDFNSSIGSIWKTSTEINDLLSKATISGSQGSTNHAKQSGNKWNGGNWDNFDLTINGKTRSVAIDKRPSSSVESALNYNATGDRNKSPAPYDTDGGALQFYNGNLYLYTSKNEWHLLGDRLIGKDLSGITDLLGELKSK